MEIDDEDNIDMDDNDVGDSNTKYPWYLINRDKPFCKLWDTLIIYIIVYSLFVCPFILAFGTIIEYCVDEIDDSNNIDGLLHKQCKNGSLDPGYM